MAFLFGSYGDSEAKRETHWKGPYDVLVPMSITSVPAHDGFNQLTRNDDGHVSSTMRYITDPLTKSEWLEKYAHKVDGVWYYRVNSQ